jgi:glycosyltransferase involved in cell wall biosynthesis
MRILMVTARFQPFVGGIETHVREVGARMAATGHQVSVLTTDPGGALASVEVVDGMTVNRVRAWPKGRDYYLSPGIYTAISRNRSWDIIHFQGYNTFVAPLGMVAAIRARLPFVLTFHSGGHSSQLRNALRGLQSTLLAPALIRARRLIAVSEFEADLFSRRLRVDRQRFAVVPNGASLPAAQAPPPKIRGPLVVSVGRLERYKGHQRVLAAFAELRRQIPDARLQIIGTGPYEPTLRTRVRALGLEGQVTIGAIGAAERHRLAELLSQAGLVVLLSEYEAHPVAVMEALSLGCRVLVNDASGLGELARKGLCRAVPPDAAPRAVALAMAEELAAPQLGARLDLPDWDSCTARLLDIYEAVLRDASGAAPRVSPDRLDRHHLGQTSRPRCAPQA